MDRRKAFFIIVLFSLIAFLLCLFAALSLNSYLAQLRALWHSNYVYSANIHQTIGKDNYYQFNAGISFSLSSNAKTGLNADILMQSDDSEYTNMVYWNADKLGPFSIAISKGLARANGLDIGDKLYSKHTVNGKICEYTIEQILPEMSSSRNLEQKNYGTGIIIMGYDSQYVTNISNTVIAYTNQPIEDLSRKYAVSPENIQYKEDEIFSICRTLIPYAMVFVLLLVLNIVGLVAFLTKDIVHNFKRLAILGFSSKELNKSYCSLIRRWGCFSISISVIISSVTLYLESVFEISVAFLLLITFIELVTLLIAVAFFKSQLWRS